MQKAIISDTSCFILLDKINQLDILQKLFGTVITTIDVFNEFGKPLPHWVIITNPANNTYQAVLEVSLDKGEASAIALAVECDDALLIIDDLKGRNFAMQLGLKVTGTLGILIEAKLSGVLPSIKPVLYSIRQTNFRISENLETIILKKAGEM